MKALLNRIHERVGDLWWYSAMIFLACRSGDAIQAFIGLWLVQKHNITEKKDIFLKNIKYKYSYLK